MPDIENGIEIVVGDSTWHAYGEPTPHNIELFNQLQIMGGISNSVTPGVYIFNVEFLDDETIVVSLNPKE